MIYKLSITLPFTDPVLKFLLILVIILIAPIVLNKIRIPHLLGLILAGTVIGPNGFNFLERDSGIILSGTAGLLYIMFLAGLEIDLADFKKNRKKSIVFGLFTFSIPMLLGFLAGRYVLNLSIPTSVLLASMFASHTLIAYPLISKMGIAKNRAVNITVGGTIITDMLALLILAVIVGMTTGEVNTYFWIKLSLSLAIFGIVIVVVFPLLGKWFLGRFNDYISQYIFVLAMVFLGSFLAELAGVEPIIGAFLSGLALNRLIPQTSPLMNRIEFVGNAIFIPFFLIGVGMLIDFRAFFKDWQTIKVALVMVLVATTAKFLAAWLTQKTYGFSLDERRVIFGLSNAQAAATLAAVLVGYNIIVGTAPSGEPIRLLSEEILNGTILMILVTCTIATFTAQKGAKNIVLSELGDIDDESSDFYENMLIPIRNKETTEELINLGATVLSTKNKNGLHALTIVNNASIDAAAHTNAKKLLDHAATIASSTDIYLNGILRYDQNIVNGIISVVREQKISDLILGLHVKKGITDSYLGKLTEGILTKCNTTTIIYKPVQPFVTIKRLVIIIPENAEREVGFPFWLLKVWNMAKNSGARLIFYAGSLSLKLVREVFSKDFINSEFKLYNWDDILILYESVLKDDLLIFVMSRKDKPSYEKAMNDIPTYLNNQLKNFGFILIYPMQATGRESSQIDFKNDAFIDSTDYFEQIGRKIAQFFKKR